MNQQLPNEVEILNAALEKSGGDRIAYVEAATLGNAALRDKIEALLRACERGPDLLDDLALKFDAQPAAAELKSGALIKGYEIIEQLGEGGCGAVYRAEQKQPLRRQVALKVIKAGMDTRNVIARFEAERQALALMDHPNIAKVFDAGSTEAGRPYFVMELVEGLKITDYCRNEKLSIHERLNLFLQVCDAVQHAHQKGIIHRDLKPSNILVSDLNLPPDRNPNPTPKVIDFGIAKAIEGKLTDATVHTGLHQFLGTPAYMSPEQADLRPDIDTRTDIYSLGVLLYELLTGCPPFDNHELLTAGLDEMRHIIREVEPKRPSQSFAAVSRQGAADSKSASGASLSAFDTDLDWIVMKCLEKDRSCRYETANALAADLKRFLLREPIAARPPSVTYRVQKFVLRHRAASLAFVFILLAVVLGGSTVLWALVRERAAHRREQVALEDARRRLEAALFFVDKIFNQVAPKFVDLPGAASAQEALGETGLEFIQRLRDGSADLPAVRLALARTLYQSSAAQNPGNANTLGNFETGLKRAKEALALVEAGPLPMSEREQVNLIYWINVAIFRCLAGLERYDEAAAHVKTLQPILDRLERFPEQAREARRNRMSNRGFAGVCVLRAGRPGEAFTNHFLPIIQSDWASNVRQFSDRMGTSAPDHYLQYELETIAGTSDNAGCALLLLKRFDEMLPFAREAIHIANFLVRQFPGNAKWQVGHAQFLSLSGVALAWTGRELEAVEALKQAREEIEQLVRLDRANQQFRRSRDLIITFEALSFVGMSQRSAAPLAERQKNLAQAESLLAEAAQLSGFASLNPTPYFKLASNEVVTARANIQSSRIELPQREQPPPGILDITR